MILKFTRKRRLGRISKKSLKEKKKGKTVKDERYFAFGISLHLHRSCLRERLLLIPIWS